MTTVISIDIGSTFTKGAVFSLSGAGSTVLRQASHPTTPDNLVRGFTQVLATLCQRPASTPLDDIHPEAPVHFSSSAKGGLAIAAIGLVPDLTLQLARLTAMSAGGKVVRSFAYSLTAADITDLERIRPDIILFCGGTDGGNTAYVTGNATLIAASRLEAPIIYAGNRAVADQVAAILKPRPVTIVPNLMPDIHDMNLEPARDKIREIFLQSIIAGKGLADIARRFGTGARPTPLGVYELMEAIPRIRPDWDDVCAIDLGGATTDFYSNTESFLETDSVVLKGIREPRLKRTVEGDLGLRISLAALLDSAADYLAAALKQAGLPGSALRDYAAALAADPGRVAATDAAQAMDDILAEACVHHAAIRHAGSLRESFTPRGRVHIQTGKDLRRVKHIIGSGGFLSTRTNARIMRRAFQLLTDAGPHLVLAPEQAVFYADAPGLFPLLGNIAATHPESAVALALENLKELK